MTDHLSTIEILSLEENFDIVIENFIEFEKEALGVLVQKIVRGSGQNSISFFDERRAATLALANLLTSSKSCLDNIERIAKAHPAFRIKEAILSPEYDAHPEYRFVHELRNHMQHHSTGIHKQVFGSFTAGFELAPKNSSLSFIADRERLRHEGFSPKRLLELPESISIVQCVRVFVGCLSSIHQKLRDSIVRNNVEQGEREDEPDARKLEEIRKLQEKNFPTDSLKRAGMLALK